MLAAHCSYLNKIFHDAPDCLVQRRLFVLVSVLMSIKKKSCTRICTQTEKWCPCTPAYKHPFPFHCLLLYIYSYKHSHTIRNVKDVHIKKVAVEHDIKLKENVRAKNNASFSALCARQASFHLGTRYCSFYVLQFTTFYPISSLRRQAGIKSSFYFAYKHHEKL